jgi:hypothetical protein
MARLTIEVTLADGADGHEVAERLFELLAVDPDDVFPDIETVDGFAYEDDA